MHRSKRGIAKRVAAKVPVASGQAATIEKAGVRATYKLHDQVLSNPSSRKLYEGSVPTLDEQQEDIVGRLSEEGYAVVPLAELFSEEVWQELAADAAVFSREMEKQVAAGAATPKKEKPGKKPKKEKFFLGRRGKAETLTLDSPWVKLAASQRMLDIVNSYMGMWSKLSYADQWYTPQRGSESDRLGSMRWHRDYNDQHLVKVFIYLVDVDEGTGPFEYVPGSAKHGPYVEEWAWAPLSDESYPPAEEFDQRIPASAVKTFTAPRGTVVFCDTSGFHRGGYATENPRDIWVYNYVSPAALQSLVERNFEVSPSALGGLSEVERFALS